MKLIKPTDSQNVASCMTALLARPELLCRTFPMCETQTMALVARQSCADGSGFMCAVPLTPVWCHCKMYTQFKMRPLTSFVSPDYSIPGWYFANWIHMSCLLREFYVPGVGVFLNIKKKYRQPLNIQGGTCILLLGYSQTSGMPLDAVLTRCHCVPPFRGFDSIHNYLYGKKKNPHTICMVGAKLVNKWWEEPSKWWGQPSK